MRRRLVMLGVAALLALTGVFPADAALVKPAAFPYGVASGEVTMSSAVLWTRTLGGPVQLQVSPNAKFRRNVQNYATTAMAVDDFTVHIEATGLRSNKLYYYRFYDPGRNKWSPIGKFMTAPGPNQDVDVHFGWSGDSDGWYDPATGAPAFNRFEVFDAARYAGAQFFVYLGDTIYSDSPFSPFGPADSLLEYRRNYRQNRGYQALRDLMANMSTYAHPDDHEVMNDYEGTTVDPARMAMGIDAFEEYMPGVEWNPVTGFYRTFRWGKNLEIFILDERTFRSPGVEDSGVCDNPAGSGFEDLAPLLPAGFRAAFSGAVPQLALPVPAGCVAALNDASRTMLGAAQKAAFKADLLASTAKFKVVFVGTSLQNQYVLPYDRWEGYLAERAEILSFITTNAIGGIVFLATDQHENLGNDVFTDFFTGVDTGLDEVIVGPIATQTRRAQVVELFGIGAANLLNFFYVFILGAECSNLFTYTYGDVMYDAGTKTLTIQPMDKNGAGACPPLVMT
ncbi:MAG: alkaline phosphatase D family protein [Actinobacteria bacterium]|nr:alkaline phosphatase D family protein [Actinomycetota bacterium]